VIYMFDRLTNAEFAGMVLGSMTASARVGACTDALLAIEDAALAEALLEASHRIARHADALERTSRAEGQAGGPCRPETAAAAVRPTAPGGVGTPSGAFRARVLAGDLIGAVAVFAVPLMFLLIGWGISS